jgi:hypothetical protein
MPFDDVETALQYVITSDHGQQVSIFGSDPRQIGALVDPWSTRYAASTSTASASAGPTSFPSPDARTRPKGRCR